MVIEYGPLPLGTEVKPFGTIEAIRFSDGERFYLIVDIDETVSLIDDATARTMIADASDGYWTDSDGLNRKGGQPT